MKSSKKLAKLAVRENADIVLIFALFTLFFLILFAVFEHFLREIFAALYQTLPLSYPITFFVFFLNLLLFSPISFSFSALIFKSCHDEKSAKLHDLFFAFSSQKLYFKVFFLNFSVFLRIFVRILVIFLPFLLLRFSINADIIMFLGLGNFSEILKIVRILQVLLLFVAVLWIFPIVLRYTFCKFVLLNNPKLKVLKAMKIGVKHYKKNKFKLLGLLFKNFHLLLFCLLLVPILWVYPLLKVRFTALCYAVLTNREKGEGGNMPSPQND